MKEYRKNFDSGSLWNGNFGQALFPLWADTTDRLFDVVDDDVDDEIE